MAAMRAFSIASVSEDTFISLVTTCSTNASTHCFAVSRSSTVGASRPSLSILSRRLPSSVVVEIAAKGFAGSAMLVPLSRPGVQLWYANFGAELIQIFLVVQDLLQQFVKLIVAVETASQVREFAAQFHQLAQRLNLFSHVLRFKVFHTFEPELDANLRV